MQCHSTFFENKKNATSFEVARTTGLEPATSAVTGRRSNQLSYALANLNGGEIVEIPRKTSNFFWKTAAENLFEKTASTQYFS